MHKLLMYTQKFVVCIYLLVCLVTLRLYVSSRCVCMARRVASMCLVTLRLYVSSRCVYVSRRLESVCLVALRLDV
jgi:hypothetical protein